MPRMKIAVLGTGMVGQTIGDKLIALGHEVKMGAREAKNEKAAAFAAKDGKASHGTFADAAAFGEIVFVCTNGMGTLDALHAAGAANLAGKVVIDSTNPLYFSKGVPPTLFVSNSDSLGEQVQRAFPDAKVVKTLNTVNCSVMVDAKKVADGDHTVFVSGNDAGAKARVTEILTGWVRVERRARFGRHHVRARDGGVSSLVASPLQGRRHGGLQHQDREVKRQPRARDRV
jgi:predicted dinucleotide-binding enzyme